MAATRAKTLDDLYRSIDAQLERLHERHASWLRCGRGCAACCTDGLSVLEVEAEHIRKRHAALLDDALPHAPGACAFLDSKLCCRIYESRPYICRSQGLPLRWFEASDPPRSEVVVEKRDVCPVHPAPPPLEGIADGDCWLLGPAEAQLQEIQERYGSTQPERILLRSLFRRPHPTETEPADGNGKRDR